MTVISTGHQFPANAIVSRPKNNAAETNTTTFAGGFGDALLGVLDRALIEAGSNRLPGGTLRVAPEVFNGHGFFDGATPPISELHEPLHEVSAVADAVSAPSSDGRSPVLLSPVLESQQVIDGLSETGSALAETFEQNTLRTEPEFAFNADAPSARRTALTPVDQSVDSIVTIAPPFPRGSSDTFRPAAVPGSGRPIYQRVPTNAANFRLHVSLSASDEGSVDISITADGLSAQEQEALPDHVSAFLARHGLVLSTLKVSGRPAAHADTE